MINLYQILNIEPNASIKSIQAGIAIYSLRDDAHPKVIAAARTHLLNPQHRQTYDQHLFASLGMDANTVHHHTTPIKPTATHQIDKKLIPTNQIHEFEHLYQFLGIDTQASYANIADAIDDAVLEGLNGKYIQDAREQLLNPDARADYDAQHHIVSAAAIIQSESSSSIQKQRGFSVKNWLKRGKNNPRPPHQTQANTQAHSSNTETDKYSPTQAAANPTPTFKRDNWYQFLGIRGDATYQEIKVAIRTAKLKGRDKELIKQAQNMLLRPANRRLYDKQNNILVFIAAQNGDIHSKVKATDYRPASQWANRSIQKICLAACALMGLSSGFTLWLPDTIGWRLMSAGPVFLTCFMTLVCLFFGHKQDPLYHKTHILLSLSFIPAAWSLSWLNWQSSQTGMYWGCAAALGIFIVPLLWRGQSRNVSFQANTQQSLAFIVLLANIVWVTIAWYLTS
ncbi:hypothetical protein ADP71_32330 [Vitreoscilla sp. C1]|uniref:hypothetical protein n=1 Tax=Vitreoscilla sp. (strain C1) TaxID=96942 RepID=UPI00148E916A|nr:hypothetical protein [Vitreoscilla sp. C1]AUZ06402.2 hypothetical protein ADP71_32330 [Vitreoscilla sp. C1]